MIDLISIRITLELGELKEMLLWIQLHLELSLAMMRLLIRAKECPILSLVTKFYLM